MRPSIIAVEVSDVFFTQAFAAGVVGDDVLTIDTHHQRAAADKLFQTLMAWLSPGERAPQRIALDTDARAEGANAGDTLAGET